MSNPLLLIKTIFGVIIFLFSIFFVYDFTHNRVLIRTIKNKLFFNTQVEIVDVKILKIELIKADNESFLQKRRIKKLYELDPNFSFQDLQSIIIDGQYLIYYEELSNNEDFKINIKGNCKQLFTEDDTLSLNENHYLKKNIYTPKQKNVGKKYYISKIITEEEAFSLMQ